MPAKLDLSSLVLTLKAAAESSRLRILSLLASGEIALRLRDDLASEINQREANQRSAPAVENGLFLVPKVIE